MKTKEKVVYKEGFKYGVFIKAGLTPVCRHQAEGYDVHSARLMAAGRVERDGESLEFQDIRIYFQERKA